METTCNHCGNTFTIATNEYNRAQRKGANLYCNRSCAGQSRRSNKSIEEKKAAKAAYDLEYISKNKEKVKAGKVAWFQRTYDPVAAAVVRKKRMPKHLEYCRQPAYKAKKKTYDRKYRLKRYYGEEYGEAAAVLLELEELLDKGQIKYDLGLINKAQKRKKQWHSQNNS